MSNLKHVSGDLIKLALSGEFDAIVHGCNCFCVMGAGIAPQIARAFPCSEIVDNLTSKGDYNKLGNYTVSYDKDVFVVNAYTQYKPSKGNDVFEYTAFDLILQKLSYEFPYGNFGFPYIGMGLAGGDSKLIISSLEKFADKIYSCGGSVTLVKYDRT